MGEVFAEALARIADVHGGGDILTTRRSTRDDTVATIEGLFRRGASASDHLAAAERLDDELPQVAELPRVWGGGRR